jgi:hypothetical protein
MNFAIATTDFANDMMLLAERVESAVRTRDRETIDRHAISGYHLISRSVHRG